jgi:hypothetical protein
MRVYMAEKRKERLSRSTGIGSGAKKKETSEKNKSKRPPSANLWGIAGRQEIMEMRMLWQLRIPRR